MIRPTVGAESGSGERIWHRVWPAHLPRSLEYPREPAWRLLERNLPRFANRVALLELDHESGSAGRTLTYAALWRAVRGAATGLQRSGVASGTRVGYCLPNSAALVIGYYATWVAGGVVVPVNPGARESEIEQHLADAGVAVVVGPEGHASATVAGRLKLPFMSVRELQNMETLPPATPVGGDPERDLAVLLYTGGTTGTPKGAMLSHRNIVVNTTQFAEWYAFAPGEEVSVCAIPMFHSGGMSGVMNVPLSTGATLLVFARFSAPAVAQAVTSHRVTRLFGVPTMFIALLNDEAGRAADYSSLRACRTNAAPLPPSVKTAFDALVGREVLVEGYGLTEASPLTHANPIDRAKAGSIGVPLPDTDARIVGVESGRDVASGESGELLIRGPQVMLGYWNRPEATAKAMSDGWLKTGDIVAMDDEGYFAVVDRLKDMINTAGFKVWPREVEETLYAHPAVKMAAVVGVADDYRGEAVKAFVVLKENCGSVDAGELTAFCRERLSGYKVPRLVELRDALPVTTTGKLLRRLLRESS